MKAFCKTIFLLMISCLCYGQDIQFSQFYSSSYFNPAYIGLKNTNRIISHSRIQWPGLDARYYSTLLSYDRRIDKINSALGIIMIHDDQADGAYVTNEAHIQYAYLLHPTKKLAINFAGQVGFFEKVLNGSKLKFPDQFDLKGFKDIDSWDSKPFLKANWADFSFGTMIFTEDFWVGLSAHHLNLPNQSLLNETSKLSTRFAIAGGYKFAIPSLSRTYITPTFQYKSQGKNDQFDIGPHVLLHNKFLGGVWYRGIPFKKYDRESHNNESFIFMVGLKQPIFQISYSYDAVISGLAGIANGAHELNITIGAPPLTDHQKSIKKVICPAEMK